MQFNRPSLIGINEYIFNNLKDRGYIWGSRNNNGNILRSFLASTGFEERNENALIILKNILDIQHKKPFYKILKYILKIEEGTQTFVSHIRDHISHSVYVYLLGELFSKKLPDVRYDDGFDFKWMLTSLLHDLGNPPHIFISSLLDYIKKIQEVGKFSPINMYLSFDKINKLTPRENKNNDAFIIIQDCLNTWNINIDIKREFNDSLRCGIIEHGIFGALLMLKSIDGLYTENNPNYFETDDEVERHFGINQVGWGRTHFDNEVVSAAAAISIHNIVDKIKGEIEYCTTPLPFLLILCDAIQEWDRYSLNRRVYDPYSIRLNFRDRFPEINFDLPDETVISISHVLNKLTIDGVQIQINESEYTNQLE